MKSSKDFNKKKKPLKLNMNKKGSHLKNQKVILVNKYHKWKEKRQLWWKSIKILKYLKRN